MRHKTLLLIIFSIFICFTGFGQNTRSPYSIFGPGELQSKSFGRGMAMGGIGIGVNSGSYINMVNPASYSGFDSLKFVYEMGFEGKYSRFKSQGNRLNDHTFNFKYIAFGFRVTDWWATSIGISPFTNVGYSITTSTYIDGSHDKFYSLYEGSGGINYASLGNAVKLGNFSLGVNSSYLFGSITQDELITQPNNIISSFIMQRTDYLHSFYFDYGAQYSFKMKEWNYTLGAIYSNEQKLVSRHQVNIMDVDYSVKSSNEYKATHLRVPEKYGLGISMKKGPLIHIAGDYEFQKWSGLKYPIQKGPFLDTHRFATGVESKPWGDIMTLDWYKKIVYRVGANYQTSFLKINGKQIDETAITFGLGIPIKNTGSLLNFTVEAGKKGTVSNRLVKENYVLFHMNFSINEIWFRKRIFY